jgi:hypothetical protein
MKLKTKLVGQTMTLALGVTNVSHKLHDVDVSTDHLTRLQLPNRMSRQDVRRMQRDFEILAEALREHPTEMANLLEAHFRMDTKTSRRLAYDLGLSEEAFKARGGGILWAVVGALVLCDVVTGCLTRWAWSGI